VKTSLLIALQTENNTKQTACEWAMDGFVVRS
jgi:hypothetical protein